MLKDFIAEIKKGALARTNRYAVLFDTPEGVNSSSLRKILLFCDQVQLPGVNFSTVQNRTFGEFREVPYEKLFDNLNISFYVDQDMKVKSMFDKWINMIQDPLTRNFNYYDKFIAPKFEIEVQDINDKTRYQLTLWEAYPKNISSVQLDNSSKDIMKLNVTIQYRYWTATTIQPLPDQQKISNSLIDKAIRNFTGFQETLNQTLGTKAGNAITGSALTYGITKLPGALKF